MRGREGRLRRGGGREIDEGEGRGERLMKGRGEERD